MRLISKTFFVLALLIAGLSPASAGDRNAEQFVNTLMQQASMVLRDNSGGEAIRSFRLHQLVLQNLDARKAALFALGPYQRQLDPRIVEDYVSAFTDYVTAVYEARLRTFRAFDFKIVTSMDAGQGDSTVITQARPPAEFRGRPPIDIWLRLSRDTGQYKIADVQIAGIWVSLYQREDFARRLSANADVRALTSYLTYQAAQIKAGNAQV
jgi:ABC-type transporter MlaC component